MGLETVSVALNVLTVIGLIVAVSYPSEDSHLIESQKRIRWSVAVGGFILCCISSPLGLITFCLVEL